MPESGVSEDKCQGKCLKEHSRAFRFENFLGGGGEEEACSQSPPAARVFGARDLPRLALKSGYGPDFMKGMHSYISNVGLNPNLSEEVGLDEKPHFL